MAKSRYLYHYEQSVCDTLISSGHIGCVMQLPSLQGLLMVASSNSNASSVTGQGALALITGQRAKTLRAKKSIAAFNLRENDVVSCLVTLRGAQLYDLLDLLVTEVMPRWPKIPVVNQINLENPATTFHNNSVCFGQSYMFTFPQLEPYFPQFESAGGFNVHMMINPKRYKAQGKVEFGMRVIWGF